MEKLVDCSAVSCAEFSEGEKCESSCGFGSGGFCLWKPYLLLNNSSGKLSRI